jgi:hypothetical protein
MPGDLECSMGGRCAVAAIIRTYYATHDEVLAREIRAAHADWRTGWVQAG